MSDTCRNGHPRTPENTVYEGKAKKRRCRVCRAEAARNRYAAHNEAGRENPAKAKVAKYRKSLRGRVFAHYGEACACCGEDTPLFLTIDHVNNDGADHRREIGRRLYGWLVSHGFPEGYQTLCYNCNSGKHLNGGKCPHEG